MAFARRSVLLIVAGRDPSGAGIDADLAAVKDLKLDARAVETAKTDQDANEVRSIGARDARTWAAEAREATRSGVAAVKFGLLPGVEHVRAASDLVRAIRGGKYTAIPVVVDPVIRASSGGVFLDEAAVAALRDELVAEKVILTPNLEEAAALARMPASELVNSALARIEAARFLLAKGAAAVVITGGHGSEDPVRDLVARSGAEPLWIERPRVRGGGIRGSGCRLASRLAGRLAGGMALEKAAADAGDFVAAEIAKAARVAGRPVR